MSTERDYFYYVKSVFVLSGYLPSKKSFRTYIQKYILTPLMIMLITFVVYDFKFMHNDIFEIATVFESLSSHGHVFGRKLSVLKHASLIEELINDRIYFWKYDLFGDIFAKNYRQNMSIRDLIMKGFHVVIFVMSLFFFLTPIFAKSIKLPQTCWIPGDSNYSRGLIYFIQIVCLTESPFFVNIIDGSFLLMCGEMEIQFNLLKKTLSFIKIGSNSSVSYQNACFEVLKMCSNYHSFLLREHKKMKTAYSEFFLLQFLITIKGLCIEIFAVNEAKTIRQFVISAIYIFAILIQSSSTFIAASFLEKEAETLVDHIYGIDWYNANIKIQKHVQFMIMKAQIPLRLSGAGMFEVNRSTLLQILKTGFSISALIRQIQ